MKTLTLAVGLTALLSLNTYATPSSDGASVYIITPQHGETVAETFTVRFGLRAMGVAPAGTEKANTGHHHLLIDGDLPPMSSPMGSETMHFGAGQTETTLTLPPGQHSLQLIFGDKDHVPHTPPLVSEKIIIRVK